MKRLFDFLCSGIALIFLFPLFIAIGLIIKFSSRGPVFFRQTRVGFSGKLFKIHKFRTMSINSELKGPQVTTSTDVRITPAGRFLRKYKIDELPQLIDVLIGNMSLVGPRPEVPEYVKYYPDAIRDIVFSVRPGITDLASIEYRNENELLARSNDPAATYIHEVLPNKLSYCVDYVQNRSFVLDLKIIMKTIFVVAFKNP